MYDEYYAIDGTKSKIYTLFSENNVRTLGKMIYRTTDCEHQRELFLDAWNSQSLEIYSIQMTDYKPHL